MPWRTGYSESRQRVASSGPAKCRTPRRLDHLVAERSSDSHFPAVSDPDWESCTRRSTACPTWFGQSALATWLSRRTDIDEDGEVPARDIEVTIRGRLARARERLRRGLVRRGG